VLNFFINQTCYVVGFKKFKIMKRKIFSALAVVLFMSSNLNANTQTSIMHNYDHCYDEALAKEKFALGLGFSYSDAYEMGSNQFQQCVDNTNLQAAIYWALSGLN
jgi:hypothetical protein